MLLPMWVRLWGILQTPIFNYKNVKQPGGLTRTGATSPDSLKRP